MTKPKRGCVTQETHVTVVITENDGDVAEGTWACTCMVDGVEARANLGAVQSVIERLVAQQMGDEDAEPCVNVLTPEGTFFMEDGTPPKTHGLFEAWSS